jgi:hypothetical protein
MRSQLLGRSSWIRLPILQPLDMRKGLTLFKSSFTSLCLLLIQSLLLWLLWLTSPNYYYSCTSYFCNLY